MKIYDQIKSNEIKSWLLFPIFFVIIFVLAAAVWVVIGGLIAAFSNNITVGMIVGTIGVVIIMILAVVYAKKSFYEGDKIILRLNNAEEAKKRDYPYLLNTVEGLCIAAGIAAPKVYVINDPSPNAFATGRDPEHASVAVTTGLLKRLNRLELEGVLAHEISHIRNYDIRFTMLVITLAGIIGILAWFLQAFGESVFKGDGCGSEGGGGGAFIVVIMFGFFALIAGTVGMIFTKILKMAISRKREYLADASGALLTRYPPGLAEALKKIAQARPMKLTNDVSSPLYIANPFGKKAGNNFLNRLFTTHPPIEDRIRELELMYMGCPTEWKTVKDSDYLHVPDLVSDSKEVEESFVEINKENVAQRTHTTGEYIKAVGGAIAVIILVFVLLLAIIAR